MQEQIMHELFTVADKVDGMVSFNEDGVPYIIGEDGLSITIDKEHKPILDFVLGVHTLVDLIQSM